MAQFARPSSDVALGGWAPIGGPTNLYECIDETTASDTDYIEAGSSDTTARIGLGSVTDPGLSTGHVVRYRGQSTGGGSPERITVELRQGATLIATISNAYNINRGAWEDVSYTLSAAEADSITDYTALELRFIVDTLSGSDTLLVSWAELEVPDPITFSQVAFRIRSGDDQPLETDDGWKANINTNADMDMEQIFRIRFEIEGNTPDSLELWYSKNGGAYAILPVEQGDTPATVSAAAAVLSSQYVDGDATTSMLAQSAKTFIAGDGNEDNESASIAFTDHRTEVEYCIKIRRLFDNKGVNNNNDTFAFRIYRNGGVALTNYTQTPTVTLKYPAGLIGGTRPEAPMKYVFEDDGYFYVWREYSEPLAEVGIDRSTDGGLIFAPVNTAGEPSTANDIEAGDLATDGAGNWYLAHQKDEVWEHVFRSKSHATNADTWGTVDTVVSAATGALEQAAGIAIRSDNDRVLGYAAAPSGSDERLAYRINSGAGYGTENILDTTTSEDHYGIGMVMDDNDLLYIFYAADNGTTITIYYKTLSSTDVLSGRTAVVSGLPNGSADRIPFTKPIFYLDGSVRVIMLAYKNGSDIMQTITIRDGVLQSAQTASDVAVAANQGASRMPSASLTHDGTTAYLMYVDETNRRLHWDENPDEAGWGTDTQENADNHDFVNATIFDSGGTTYLAYVREGDVNGGTGGLIFGKIALLANTTGTLAATLDDLTSNGAVDVDVDGSTAATLDDLSSSSAGDVDVTGSTNQALEDLTSSSAAGVEITGSTSQTLEDATLSATGEVVSGATGSLAATLEDATLSADSTVDIDGQTAVTLEDVTSSSAGEIGVTGQTAVTLDDASLTSQATADIAGSVNTNLEDLGSSSVATVDIEGTAAVTLEDATLSAAGTIDAGIIGDVNVTLEDASITADGVVEVASQTAVTLDGVTSTASGAVEVEAAVTSTLEDATLAAAVTAASGVLGDVNATFEDAALVADVTAEVEGQTAITLEAATAVGLGQNAITGNAIATLADATLDASGAISGEIQGQLVAALGDASLVSLAAVDVVGVLAVTLEDATLIADDRPLYGLVHLLGSYVTECELAGEFNEFVPLQGEIL